MTDLLLMSDIRVFSRLGVVLSEDTTSNILSFLAPFSSPTCPEALQLPNAHQLLASFVHLSLNPVGLSVVSVLKTADKEQQTK